MCGPNLRATEQIFFFSAKQEDIARAQKQALQREQKRRNALLLKKKRTEERLQAQREQADQEASAKRQLVKQNMIFRATVIEQVPLLRKEIPVLLFCLFYSQRRSHEESQISSVLKKQRLKAQALSRMRAKQELSVKIKLRKLDNERKIG